MADEMQRFTEECLVRLSRVESVVPSPSGSWLACAVGRLDSEGAKYVSDLWRVSLEDDGAAPVRLTRGDDSDRAPWFRSDGSLGFLSNRAPEHGKPPDTPRDQVWLLPAEGGEPMQLTDEPLGVLEFKFAAAGDRLVALAPALPGVPFEEQREAMMRLSKRGPSALHYRATPVRVWDHWLGPAWPRLVAFRGDGSGRRDLTPGAEREYLDASWDLSPNGARLVTSCAGPGTDRIFDAWLRVFELDGGTYLDVAQAPRRQASSPRFSNQADKIAYVAEQRHDERTPEQHLYVWDLAASAERCPAWAWDRWPELAGWTADDAALIATAGDHGQDPVFRIGVEAGEVTRLTAPAAGGSHRGVHVVGDRIVGVRSRILHPPEPFVCELTPASQPRLLACLSGLAPEDGARLARWESLEVTVADGTPIQTFLTRPADRDGPLPLLLWIHGGPQSHWGDSWHWRWNPVLAASAGYAVVTPNPRGSTGFGQAFLDGIWNNTWGAACYDDLMAVTDAVAQRDDVDGQRAVAMGGSFGGYMTNWLAGRTDRFRCLVTHASLFDFSAFYGSTDVGPWISLQFAGSPHDNGDNDFDRYSPHRNVRYFKTPTLILHGEQDFRVPITEALALFEALQSRGVPSELLVFPDENHWIRKPENIKRWYRGFLDFVDEHLSEGEPAGSSRAP